MCSTVEKRNHARYDIAGRQIGQQVTDPTGGGMSKKSRDC